MNFFENFKNLLGIKTHDLTYVFVHFEFTLTLETIKDVSSYWISQPFVSLVNQPEIRSLIKNKFNLDDSEIEKAVEISNIQFFKYFPFIGLLIEKEKIKKLKNSLNVNYVYEVPFESCFNYLNILKGLNYIIEHNHDDKKSKISVANMSLGPLEPYSFDEKETMNVATSILHDNGVVIVVAVGNDGNKINTLNPWSVAPWVIGVGAAYQDGKKLWEESSIGIPNDPINHPTVVAPGVDIIGLRSPEGTYNAIDEEGKYTVKSGTSFAVPQVAGIAALCIEFIDLLAKSPEISQWKHDAVDMGAKIGSIKPTPDIIKAMIEDMAIEMPQYEVYQVGSGFIDKKTANDYFENFKLSNFIKIFAIGKWS